jgi:hypothetical protein
MTPQEATAYLHDRIDAALAGIIWEPENFDMTDLTSRAFDVSDDGDHQPRPWITSDGPKMTAGIMQASLPVGVSIPAETPCPPWCDRRHEHPFTSTDLRPTVRLVDADDDTTQSGPSAAYRTHRHRFGTNPVHAALETQERAATFDVSATDLGTDTGALSIAIYANSTRPAFHLTPAGARRLADQLATAADMADQQLADWTPHAETSQEQCDSAFPALMPLAPVAD